MAEAVSLDGSRVLVTGGAGFIGSNFVHHFLRRFPAAHVVVLDALTYAGRRENLDGLPPARLTFLHGDIRDPAAVAPAMEGCDLVVNFAAETHVDRSIESPGDFIQTDVHGVFVLCEEARRRGVRRFLQVSTDEVYGEVLEGAATEAWPLMPRSPYAASKAGGDRLAFAYWATYGLPVVVTRCSNNYGPRQYPEKLVPLFVTNAIEDQPLPVYGTGRNRRDFDHRQLMLLTRRRKVGTVTCQAKYSAVSRMSRWCMKPLVMQRACDRQGTASTLRRGEVSGSGKKPWKQKHTGRARAGSLRSPVWRHGGTVFGPKPRSYAFGMPRKKYRAALQSALSAKVLEGNVLVVSDLAINQAKTKLLANALSQLGISGTALLVVGDANSHLVQAGKNLSNVTVLRPEELNVYDVLRCHSLVIPQSEVNRVKEVWS